MKSSIWKPEIVMPVVVGGHPGDALCALDFRLHENDGGIFENS